MEHISNMGHSLDAIKHIVNLHVVIGSQYVRIHIKETYPFFDEDAYKQEVKEYRIKHNNEDLTKELKQHLSICEEIIEEWKGRLELWEARSRFTDKENEVDGNILYKIYCTLGGRRNNIWRFDGEIMLLRKNNEKTEIGIQYMSNDIFWSEYNPEIHPPIPNADKNTLTVHLVRNAECIRHFLSEYVSSEKNSQIIEQAEQQVEKLLTVEHSQQLQQQLIIPQCVLVWLQNTTCTNGKTYIEDETAKPLKWLQNKQLARELLTHNKIRGSLTKAEVERQAPNIFIDNKDCKPLNLSKNKKNPSVDSDNLNKFLATL